MVNVGAFAVVDGWAGFVVRGTGSASVARGRSTLEADDAAMVLDGSDGSAATTGRGAGRASGTRPVADDPATGGLVSANNGTAFSGWSPADVGTADMPNPNSVAMTAPRIAPTATRP